MIKEILYEIMEHVWPVVLSVGVPIVFVALVRGLLEWIKAQLGENLHRIAEDAVLWAESQAKPGTKFEAALVKFLSQAPGVDEAKARLLIQASFERLREVIHEGRGNG